MRHTFLSTRQPDEAWKQVLGILNETGFNMAATAKRLKVSRAALYAWLSRNPKLKKQVEVDRKAWATARVTGA